MPTTALIHLTFDAAERTVVGMRHGCRASVVAKKKDQRVVIEVEDFECSGKTSNSIVHGTDHGGTGSSDGIFYAAHAIEIRFRGLQGHVRRIVGEIKKERFTVVATNERGCFASKRVREVLRLHNRFSVAFDRNKVLRRIGIIRIRLEVIMSAAQESELLLKAALQGMELRRGPQMPFTDLTGGISRIRQDVGDRYFSGGQAGDIIVRIVIRVVFIPEAMLIAARHQSGASGAAKRM